MKSVQVLGRKLTDQVHGAIVMDEIGWVTKNTDFPKQTVNLEALDQNKDMMDHMYKACVDQKCGLDIVHNGAPFGSDHMSVLSYTSLVKSY